MDYANKLSTLQERAIIQFAVNLYERNIVKELILGLVQQDAALEKEYQKLTEELPHLLRDRVRTWIKRIALEFHSYRCRLQLLFGVSRYFLMTFLSIGDWKETGRLDEKKVALRLLEDERLTVFQKYHIACVYCLHVHIPELWKRLTKEEISMIRRDINDLKLLRGRICSGILMRCEYYKTHVSVLLWSYQMERNQKEKLTERELWTYAAEVATYYGNRAALALCWEKLNEETRHQIVVRGALLSLEECRKKLEEESPDWRNLEKLEEISWPNTKLAKNVFDLRSHHAELLLFFLSQMDEEQKLTFSKRVFSHYTLDFFLHWPLQHELLRTINKLGGIINKRLYRECMFTLAEKCSENSTKENHIDDYRNLFWNLWETTSEDMKQYVFEGRRYSFHLLYFLLKRSPFLKEDEALFNRVFSDLSQEDRREMMHSKQGEQFISKLLEQKRWLFLNWFLEECLPKDDIPSLKKEFIKSFDRCNWCLDNLGENREILVQAVIDWCFEFDSEKSRQFKCELLNPANFHGKYSVRSNLREGKFAEAEYMIDLCVSSYDKKKEIKVDFALWACKDLLQRTPGAPDWKQMDKILSWSLASDDDIRDIKKCLLDKEGIDSHYAIVFGKENWDELERFYKWFDLSPKEIEDHKNVIFNDRYLSNVLNMYLRDANTLLAPLRWFLTDEEKVIRFKQRCRVTLNGFMYNNMGQTELSIKEWLDCIESELLRGL